MRINGRDDPQKLGQTEWFSQGKTKTCFGFPLGPAANSQGHLTQR